MLQRGNNEGDEKDNKCANKQKRHAYRDEHHRRCLASTQAMHRHDREDIQDDGIDAYGRNNDNAKIWDQVSNACDNTNWYAKQQIGITLGHESSLSTKSSG